MISKFWNYFNRDIWRIPAHKLKGPKGSFIRGLRIFITSFRQFSSDQCPLHAAALTFFSLLSIVPVFAMAFGIAKGFGLDKVLKDKLLDSAQGQQEIFGRIFEFSENALNNTKGGLIAGIGLGLLFWTIIQVLSNIERAFNHIWGIKKQRSLGQKFSDYLALMLIAPIFFIIASSATVFIASQVELITAKVAILGAVGPFLFTLLKALPVLIFSGLLTYVYIFLPNGKIHFKSAFLGGLVAGVIYHFVQWGYIHFQIGASSNGAIYGTFAALPLFLIWLQLSWQIVLYGAELAFSHQNDRRFEFENECMTVNQQFKKLLALRLSQACVTRFAAGLEPLSDEQIADEVEAPIRLVRDILYSLTEANVLSLVHTEDERQRFYQPARDISVMSIGVVLHEMDKAGSEDIPLLETPELEKLRVSLKAFDRALEHLPENVLLKDLSPFSFKKNSPEKESFK